MEPKWLLILLTVLFLQGWCETEGCLEQERIALLKLKSFFNRPYSLRNWVDVKGSDCCQWERVDCSITSRRVIRLSLNNTRHWGGRYGYLNATFFLPFEELKSLYLIENGIAGFVDDQGKKTQLMISLEVLDLSFNALKNDDLAYLGGLSNLKSLNIENNQLQGSIDIKENTSLGKLKVARLDRVFVNGTASLLQLIETFSSVKTLFLGGNNLNETISTQELHVSSKVEELLLDGSHLNNNVLQIVGVLASLKTLSLRDCGLIGTLQTQGWCDLRNLEVLDISENALEGTLPSCFGNLSSLHYLDISDNQFIGNGPSTSLGNLTLLRFVSLSRNLFQVPDFFISFANHSHLKVLSSDQNKLVKESTSFQTWIPKFQLKVFRMSNCTTKELHNELPKFLYYQYDLSIVDLSYNNFGGKIPSWLLVNNTRLQAFLMEGNSFMGPLQLPTHPNSNLSILDISENRIHGQIPRNICSTFPQLSGLNLSGNALEGNIPACLGGLNTPLFLDLSNNRLSGGIPEELAKSDSLWFLRLSNNNLSGKIAPTIFSLYSICMIFLDGNKFDGEIPIIDISTVHLSQLFDMDLSNNNLTGKLPKWIWNVSALKALALSNNRLEGPIPMELCYLENLEILDLSQNNISGPIPSCFNAQFVRHLHLSKNRLSGTLAGAFFNSTTLVTLDLSGNYLTGEIPSWVGNLSALSVLLLKGNYFTGGIPVQLCESYSLSIIDLSQNNLSGPIPSCLSHLTLEPNGEKSSTKNTSYYIRIPKGADFYGMTIFERHNLRGSEATFLDLTFENHMEEQVDYTTKRGLYTYKGNILEYMSGIDLSCNRLTGEIPLSIGNLSEIRSLNLSHNNLTGVVPSTFSKLKEIESLDLSHNNLIGRIPVQLTELNALAVFNVSYNNLSGSIPPQKAQFGTFDESSYMENPLLCGPPLHKNCTETDSIQTIPNASDSEEESCLVDKYVFYVTFLVSYAIVLIGIAAILYINPYWRRAWFYFIEQCIETCHFHIVDNLLSIFRRSR
ncbi:hypothetical protein REPUB_Repub03eG0106900 [Reevesia pubescens]